MIDKNKLFEVIRQELWGQQAPFDSERLALSIVTKLEDHGLAGPFVKVKKLDRRPYQRGKMMGTPKCECQITQFRYEHRAPSFACENYATWEIDGANLCGRHAGALVWERVLQENGYNAHSDGILIQDGLRPSKGRKEPTD